MEAIVGRVNRTSALWQQFDFLCDLLVVDPGAGARYYEELPLDYVHAAEWEELLVTESDSKLVALGERKVMGYYGTGAGMLLHDGRRVPLGSYECAGMVDIATDGTSLQIECTVSAPDGATAQELAAAS